MNVRTILFLSSAVNNANTKMRCDINDTQFKVLVLIREITASQHMVGQSSLMTFCKTNHIPMSDRTVEIATKALEDNGLLDRHSVGVRVFYTISPAGLDYMTRVGKYITRKLY